MRPILLQRMIFFRTAWECDTSWLDERQNERAIRECDSLTALESPSMYCLSGNVYTYVKPMPPHDSIRIDRLSSNRDCKIIRDILVIWYAMSPEREYRIVGWYNLAELSMKPQEATVTLNNSLTERIIFNVKTQRRHVKLLRPDERIFVLPRTRKGGPGASPIWYAQRPENERIKEDVLHYILEFQGYLGLRCCSALLRVDKKAFNHGGRCPQCTRSYKAFVSEVNQKTSKHFDNNNPREVENKKANKRPAYSSNELSPQEIYDRSLDCVVRIRTPTGTGTGFLTELPNLVISNRHVISGSGRVECYFQDGRAIEAQVLWATRNPDLAFLKLLGQAPSRYISFSSRNPQIGESVYTLGYPHGLELIFTTGTITSADQKINDHVFMTTTAAGGPGNSGGPLLNKSGQLVGVITAGIKGEGNIFFAIPLEHVKKAYVYIKERYEFFSMHLYCRVCGGVSVGYTYCDHCGCELPKRASTITRYSFDSRFVQECSRCKAIFIKEVLFCPNCGQPIKEDNYEYQGLREVNRESAQ